MARLVRGDEESEYKEEEWKWYQKVRIDGYEGEDHHRGDGLDGGPPCEDVFDLILNQEYHSYSASSVIIQRRKVPS